MESRVVFVVWPFSLGGPFPWPSVLCCTLALPSFVNGGLLHCRCHTLFSICPLMGVHFSVQFPLLTLGMNRGCMFTCSGSADIGCSTLGIQLEWSCWAKPQRYCHSIFKPSSTTWHSGQQYVTGPASHTFANIYYYIFLIFKYCCF